MMSRRDEGGGIRCHVGLFSRQDARVTASTEAINRASTAREKATAAESLREAVDVLLECHEYEEESVDCHLCRGFSELRRQMAALVVKAGRLDDRRRHATSDRRRP